MTENSFSSFSSSFKEVKEEKEEKDSKESKREDKLTKSVSERFIKAKLEQQKRENERIESFRQIDSNKNKNSRRSLAGRWEEVLTESKVDEKNKYETQRRQTISSFLSAYEDGLVKKRISHFESLVMQRATSAEKILATIRASKGNHTNRSTVETNSTIYNQHSNNNNNNNNNNDNNNNSHNNSFEGGQYSNNSLLIPINAINFYCGSTQTYNFTNTSTLRSLLLDCLMANSKEPIPLLCGIYSTTKDVESPLEVIAVAMLDDSDENFEEPYIAITINILPGHESDEGIYGIKKIALFLSSGNEESDDQTLLWDAAFNLLPSNENLQSNYDENNNENNNDHLNNTENSELLDSSYDDSNNNNTNNVNNIINGNEDNINNNYTPIQSIDENENNKYNTPTKNRDFSDRSELTDIHLIRNELDILSQEGDTNIHGRGIGNYVSSSDSSVDEGDQTWKEVIPEAEKSTDTTEGELHEKGSIFSLAKAKGMPEVRQSSVIPATNDQNQKNYSGLDAIPWSIKDANIPENYEMKSIRLDLHVRDILSSSCSSNAMVFRLKSGVSLIMINSLKYCINSSNYVVTDDLIFEWVRGVAKSGWLYKWPMKNQKAGMMTRRFFILRDRILSYHRVEPSSQEEASADYSMHSIKLKKGHYVQRSRHHMRTCVKLDTVNDALWVRCNSKEEEDEWIAAIWEGIGRYNRASPFYWKTRVEMVWHHELPTFQCIGVDAVSKEGKYCRAALYCCSSTLAQSSPTKRISRTNSFGQSNKEFLPGDDAIYSLEYGTSIDNEVHLEVLSLIAAAECPRLLCLKILGDVIMVGGTNGYIGIAVVGAPARYRLEIPYSKKLSESGICEVICRQYEGHQPESHVLKITSDEELSLFVSGDSLGGIALWKQRKRTGISFLGSLKGRSLNGSRITDIIFTPTKTHLIIGTVKKLLLVGLCSANDGSYRLEGLSEIESCDISLCCYYSFTFTSISYENQENNQKDALIVWKVVSETSECADSMSRSSVDGSDLLGKPTQIYRYILKNDVLQNAANNLQPIIRYREQEISSPEKILPSSSFSEPSTPISSLPELSPQKSIQENQEKLETPPKDSQSSKPSWRGAAKSKLSGSKLKPSTSISSTSSS